MKHKSQKARVWLTLFTLAITATLASQAFAGIKVAGDDKKFLKLGGLLQAQGVITKDAAPSGEQAGTEFYVRRIRLMAYGQLNDKVNFFIETDNPNFGKNGNMAVNMFIQDAYVELNLHKAFQVDIGMLLLPFSHHGMQGATSLLGMDYHVALMKYPDGGHKVWRDYGIMFRGMISKWFEYRLGVFNGVHGDTSAVAGGDGTWNYQADPRNSRDLPRVTARLTFNILDPEGGPGVGGMFYDGLYIEDSGDGIVSKKKVLSVGGSIDWQHNLNVAYADAPTTGTVEAPENRAVAASEDYFAVAADAFWDIPLGDRKIMSLNGQAGFYYYNHGDRSEGLSYYDVSGNSKMYSGYGIAAELGFRYDFIQPLIGFDWFQSDGAWAADEAGTGALNNELGDYMGIYGGINYWMFAQSFNLKLQVGGTQANGADEWGISGALQAQLLF